MRSTQLHGTPNVVRDGLGKISWTLPFYNYMTMKGPHRVIPSGSEQAAPHNCPKGGTGQGLEWEQRKECFTALHKYVNPTIKLQACLRTSGPTQNRGFSAVPGQVGKSSAMQPATYPSCRVCSDNWFALRKPWTKNSDTRISNAPVQPAR